MKRVRGATGELLPPLDNVVGVTTANMAAEKGNFIKAVIRARRKAVEHMHQDPDEASVHVAKHYNIDLPVARSAVRFLTSSKTNGIPYWGTGQIRLDGMKRMIEVQRMVGTIKGDVDYNAIIDTQFLPPDIQKIIEPWTASIASWRRARSMPSDPWTWNCARASSSPSSARPAAASRPCSN